MEEEEEEEEGGAYIWRSISKVVVLQNGMGWSR